MSERSCTSSTSTDLVAIQSKSAPEQSPKPTERSFAAALVCMPFASAERPSIQTALLAAIGEQAGFEVQSFHFNLDLATQLSPKLYECFSEHRGHMTGEWLFALAAFGQDAPGDDGSYFRDFPDEAEWVRNIGKDPEFLVDLRQRVLPAFIQTCAAAVNWSQFKLVGFSSTFQQNVASLALARRIKELYPGIMLVFGGANMEGEMGREFARAFPFVDYIVSGEGDLVFPALLHSVAANEKAPKLAGLIENTPDGMIDNGQAPPTRDLNCLPVPNYSAYFARATELGLLRHYQTVWTLPFESSRGCWWGQKHHCTFCGLNGLGMVYRAKHPSRVLDELAELTRKYRISAFTAVDNIMDWTYIPALFTTLADRKLDYLFFYEVKANLTPQQIRTLFKGGVRRLQPGVESMSSHVLQLMRKGSTMLQNVRCLKWCLYYGIRVDWNLIWGFPGETREDYEKELKVLERITHLEPPLSVSRIWLERFSPYFNDRDTFPVRNVTAEASYRHVYPAHVDKEKLAYFFDFEMGDTTPEGVHRSTEALVLEWQKAWQSSERHTLTYRRTSDELLIDYNWGAERRGTYCLSGAPSVLYECCIETMHTVDQLVKLLRDSSDQYDYAQEDVRAALEEFCNRGLMLSENGRYFSLALPSNPNW